MEPYICALHESKKNVSILIHTKMLSDRSDIRDSQTGLHFVQVCRRPMFIGSLGTALTITYVLGWYMHRCSSE